MKTSEQQVLLNVGDNLFRSRSSGIYYALFKRDGKQIRRSLKTDDKDLARRRLEELRSKVNRLADLTGKAIAFEDVAKRWLDAISATLKGASHRRRESAINSLKPFFKGKTIRSIGKLDIEHWATQRSGQRAARTFNIERETLRQVFDYAIRHGLLLENPTADLKRRKELKTKARIPTRKQFRQLVGAMRESDRRYWQAADLCEFLAYSGCRLGEATAMTWGDVNFELKNFTVTGGERGTKNYEARCVPLFPALKGLLKRMKGSLAAEPQRTDRIFEIESAKKAIATSCRKTKLPDFTHHSLRHFFCSNAIEAGIDFKVIAGWVGHKDGGILVAKTYGHLRDEHSAQMAKRMTFDASLVESEPENIIRLEEAAE